MKKQNKADYKFAILKVWMNETETVEIISQCQWFMNCEKMANSILQGLYKFEIEKISPTDPYATTHFLWDGYFLSQWVYLPMQQENAHFLGVQPTTGAIAFLKQSGKIAFTRNIMAKATIGAFLVKSSKPNEYFYYNKAFMKLMQPLYSSHISDFAICDAVSAKKMLDDTTGLVWEPQKPQPIINKGNGLYRVPASVTWECLLPNDAVPCKLILKHRYRLSKIGKINVLWEVDAKPLNVKSFRITQTKYY